MISYMHNFVIDTDGKFRKTLLGIATGELIQFIAFYSKSGWDLNTSFYFMEFLAKQAFGEALPYAKLRPFYAASSNHG